MAEPVSTTAMLIKAAPYVLAGMQMLGGIGSNVYGGRQRRRQQEENERATARASMISALTGGSARPQPDIIGSAGADAFNTLSNIGSIGMSVLPFIKGSSPTVTSATRGLTTSAGRTQNNPIIMPNTDVVANRYISPPLTPMPSRLSGGVYNPLPPHPVWAPRPPGGL